MNDYVGSIFSGYCNGYFGRDSYGEKLILATGFINGKRWITVKEDSWNGGYIVSSVYDLTEELFQEWLRGEEEQEESYEYELPIAPVPKMPTLKRLGIEEL